MDGINAISDAPWRVQVPMADMPTEDFLVWREQQKQRYQIETRKAMTNTPSLYFWTRRVTSSDIISMITTTKPIGSGQLKQDIGPEWKGGEVNNNKSTDNKDSKTINKHKTPFNEPVNPLHKKHGASERLSNNNHGDQQTALSPEERQRINQALWLEQKQFMEKLNRKRAQRFQQETAGATCIQSVFRGFAVRKQMPSLHAALMVRKSIREDLRGYLKYYNLILQGVEYKQKTKEMRHTKAIVIQSAYRRVLSYRAYERKKLIRVTDQRHKASSTIQRSIRVWRSKQLTDKLRERQIWLRRQAACVRIQAFFRAFKGRQRYAKAAQARRDNAAVVIQSLYRRRRSHKRVKVLRTSKEGRSREYGSKCIQRIVRGFMGRRRASRLKAIAHEKKRARAILSIQTSIRKCLGCRRVALRRIRLTQSRRLLGTVQIQRVCRGFIGRKRAANRKLLLSVDIWAQAKAGDEVLVEDIYTGALTGEPLGPDLQDAHGNTLLILAARYGHLKIVRKCLQWDMKLNVMNDKSQTALHCALAHRHTAVAEYLLSKPEALMVVKSGTRTLLHEAAKGGLHQCALILVNYGVDVDSIDPATGRTPLHEACKHGHAGILRLLLKDCKAINAQDKEGQTALHWASTRGCPECIGLLIDAGAELSLLDTKGQPALVRALLKGNESGVSKLKAAWVMPKELSKNITWGEEELQKALLLAEQDKAALLEELLSLGLPINTTEPLSGDTLLTRAAYHGSQATIGMLVKAGANLEHTTARGVTALHLALKHRSSSSWGTFDVSVLASKGSMLVLADRHGRNAFHYAGKNGYDVSRFPKVNATEINRRDSSGLTPLHWAASSTKPKAIRSLLSLGADPSMLDNMSRSPLHTLAATHQRNNSKDGGPTAADIKDSLIALLAANAGILNARDTKGCTPVLLASINSNIPCLEGLLIKASSKDKTEAAFAAVRSGQVRSLEVILASTGVDVNSLRDEENGGLNLIGCAIKEGQHSILEWLLAQGADLLVCCERNTNRFALHLIGAHGTVKDLRSYLEIGKIPPAKILEEKDAKKQTALTVAILAHNHEVADALIKYGALARNALQVGTWGWVLAVVSHQERGIRRSSGKSNE